MNKRITVIDSIMGSGKTNYAVQYINSHKDENILYVTPFLAEIDRVISQSNRQFSQPNNFGHTKLENLNDLLACQYDVAATHELFRRFTDETREHIREGHYTLILDEVLNAIEPYDDIRKDDMQLLQDSDCIYIDKDGFVVWNEEKADFDTKYNKIKVLAQNKSLLYVDKTMLLWRYPPDVFLLFDKVYILTYLFEASSMKYYFDLFQIPYCKKSVTGTYGFYSLSDYYVPDTKCFADLINIYDGKMNENLTQNDNGLSVTWFSKPVNKKSIEQLKKNLDNYFINVLKAPADTVIWTTFKDQFKKLKGQKRSKIFETKDLQGTEMVYGFVSCNARSTNRYADCYNLAYCVNIYPHPAVVRFFQQNGITVDQDLYALSEMIQWIWRSRIRRGENINIYIPSYRMRNLLQRWLDMELGFQKENIYLQ